MRQPFFSYLSRFYFVWSLILSGLIPGLIYFKRLRKPVQGVVVYLSATMMRSLFVVYTAWFYNNSLIVSNFYVIVICWIFIMIFRPILKEKSGWKILQFGYIAVSLFTLLNDIISHVFRAIPFLSIELLSLLILASSFLVYNELLEEPSDVPIWKESYFLFTTAFLVYFFGDFGCFYTSQNLGSTYIFSVTVDKINTVLAYLYLIILAVSIYLEIRKTNTVLYVPGT